MRSLPSGMAKFGRALLSWLQVCSSVSQLPWVPRVLITELADALKASRATRCPKGLCWKNSSAALILLDEQISHMGHVGHPVAWQSTLSLESC